MRPSFETIYMRLALDLEKRSTCQRKQVGCVITTTDFEHICGVGYNGTIPGAPNICERPDEPGNCGCEHAESNALLKVSTPHNIPKILFTTWFPCMSCTKKILIKKGIVKIYYLRDYKANEGMKLFQDFQIEIERLHIDYAPQSEQQTSIDP